MQYPIPHKAVIFEEEIKKSRFITYLQHTPTIEDARQFWQDIRQQHPTARHWCWAAVAGAPNDSQALGFSDDGEPAGTAGKPMLACLQGSGVGEISAVVVRYFGGVLLGTGGLVRAYSSGVQQALKLLETEVKIERSPFRLVCDYHQIDRVQQYCQQFDVMIVAQDYQEKVSFELAISSDKISPFQQILQDYSSGQLYLQPLENSQ